MKFSWFVRLESSARRKAVILAGLVVTMYAVIVIADKTGMIGNRTRAHDPVMAYSSLTSGDVAVESMFSSIEECEKFRSEFLANKMPTSECKLGADLDRSN